METMNAKEFAGKHGVTARTVARWIAKGYLPYAVQDECTKVYKIPEDTPKPYKGNARVTRIDDLIQEILNAAKLRQAVFPTMFPKMEEEIVEQVMEELNINCYVCILSSSAGDKFPVITEIGVKFQEALIANKDRVAVMIDEGLTEVDAIIINIACMGSVL